MLDIKIVSCKTILHKSKVGRVETGISHHLQRGRVPTAEGPCRRHVLRLDNVDETTAEAFHAFGRMMHVNRLAMAKIGAHKGRHHGEVVTLASLSRSEGMSQSELAAVLHLSAPRVSMILDSLEESGDVLRKPDDTDRRLTRIFLTEGGRRRFKKQKDVLEDYVNKTIGALSDQDRIELTRILGLLAERTLDLLGEDGA